MTAAKLSMDAACVDGRSNPVSVEGTRNVDPLDDTFLDNTTYHIDALEYQASGTTGLWMLSPSALDAVFVLIALS